MSNTLDKHAANYIRPNRRHLVDLPEPGTEWRSCETTKWIADKIGQLRERGIITCERTAVEQDGGESYRRGVYTTNPAAYEIIQEAAESRDGAFLPCGHDPFRNDPDVDGVVCKICDDTHTREEVLEQ